LHAVAAAATAAVASLTLFAGTASADTFGETDEAAGYPVNHTRFVLFGDPNPEARAVPSENRAVHPITSPYTHEDSFVTTDLRGWFAWHEFADDVAIDGGDGQVYALQIRVAITDQIQFVAYKDGYVDLNTGLIEESGFNDLAAGVKWAFLQDFENQFHAAVGAGYEFGIGDEEVLQGDDEVRVWTSVNKGFGPLHLGATVNGIFSVGDEDALGDSDRINWHFHADYFVTDWFSPVVEFNGYHVIDEGSEVVPFSGADLLNLGGGDDVITAGVGAEFRPLENLAVRGAFEFPITDNEDLFGTRVTASVVYSF
jgi:hypothetical protein